MRRLDHYAIYLLTAGTYTRFSLGWTLFILEWALVKVGIAVELRPVGTRRILTVAIYVIMGLSITKLRNIEPLTLRMSRSQRSP